MLSFYEFYKKMQEQAGPGMVAGVAAKPTPTTPTATTTTTTTTTATGTTPATAKKNPADVAKLVSDPGIQGVAKSIANIQNPKIKADWIKQYTKAITGKEPKLGTPALQIPTVQQLVSGMQ